MATVEERQTLYRGIEAITGNPLIVWATSRRPNASGIIAADSVDEFIDQLDSIDGTPETIDVLVDSNGGDALVVWRLISVIRQKCSRMRVLVPHSAFSAATLFCLGADEIVMGKYGCLGPIDPQITVKGKDGNVKNFAFEDVLAFFKLVRWRFPFSPSKGKEVLSHLFASVEPFSLGFASRSSGLSLSMGAKLLRTHKSSPISWWKARSISKKLNKSFFNHSHPVNKIELAELGLNVTNPPEDLADLMWQVHEAIDIEFENRKPFDTLSNYLEHNQPLTLGGQTLPFGEYEFELKFVIIESSRSINDLYARYRTTVYRDQTAVYHPVNVVVRQGWRN